MCLCLTGQEYLWKACTPHLATVPATPYCSTPAFHSLVTFLGRETFGSGPQSSHGFLELWKSPPVILLLLPQRTQGTLVAGPWQISPFFP